MAQSYTVKLLKRELVAENTLAFHFEKPADFTFVAGQFLRLTLPSLVPENGRPNVRPFSIASTAYEPDLMIAIRSGQSEFKRALQGLTPGADVQIAGPYGRFTLQEDASVPAVFLAGGIGVTPMRSIILQALHDEKPHQLFLFYSNRTPEDAVFLPEFRAAADQYPTFALIPTMTAMETSESPWGGRRTYIDTTMLREYVEGFNTPVYFIAGPAAMALAMRTMLTTAGVPETHIQTELFSGYT